MLVSTGLHPGEAHHAPPWSVTPRTSQSIRSTWPHRLCRARARCAAPAETITPALIEAAKKEGRVVWYTSADLQLAETVAKAFEKK
ncbi:MAG: hypothetical protein EXR03_08390, partial [Pseudolabrys sp.]|nr:hypothetical protein [Pseudolabrys sp.]